jgi:hypothetical protein
VVWVQGAIQDGCYPLPFGGQSCLDFGVEDPIVDIWSPMVLGVPNPIVGDAASHVTDTDLPPEAHVVVINDNMAIRCCMIWSARRRNQRRHSAIPG